MLESRTNSAPTCACLGSPIVFDNVAPNFDVTHVKRGRRLATQRQLFSKPFLLHSGLMLALVAFRFRLRAVPIGHPLSELAQQFLFARCQRRLVFKACCILPSISNPNLLDCLGRAGVRANQVHALIQGNHLNVAGIHQREAGVVQPSWSHLQADGPWGRSGTC